MKLRPEDAYLPAEIAKACDFSQAELAKIQDYHGQPFVLVVLFPKPKA